MQTVQEQPKQVRITQPRQPADEVEKARFILAREAIRSAQSCQHMIEAGASVTLPDGRVLREGDEITPADLAGCDMSLAELIDRGVVHSLDPETARNRAVKAGDTHRCVKAFSAHGRIYEPHDTVSPEAFTVEPQPERKIPEERINVHPPAAMRAPEGYFIELVKPGRTIAAIPAQDGAERLADLERRGFLRRLTDEELAQAKTTEPAKKRAGLFNRKDK